MFKHTLALIGLSALTLSANAALYDRGNGLIYDDVLDITWLQDANYSQTSNYDSDGKMIWAAAKAWAAGLSYSGYEDWRLPSANLINSAHPCVTDEPVPNANSCDRGFNNTRSELGHMYYNNLANLAPLDSNGNPQSAYGITNSDFIDAGSGSNLSILNFKPNFYWLDEEYALDTDKAWGFLTSYGYQQGYMENESFLGWAVRAGDVTAPVVPVPEAIWLFSTALLSLVGTKRRYRSFGRVGDKLPID